MLRCRTFNVRHSTFLSLRPEQESLHHGASSASQVPGFREIPADVLLNVGDACDDELHVLPPGEIRHLEKIQDHVSALHLAVSLVALGGDLNVMDKRVESLFVIGVFITALGRFPIRVAGSTGGGTSLDQHRLGVQFSPGDGAVQLAAKEVFRFHGDQSSVPTTNSDSSRIGVA